MRINNFGGRLIITRNSFVFKLDTTSLPSLIQRFLTAALVIFFLDEIIQVITR